MKQDNQYNELKKTLDKKINENISNYKNLENYVNQYQENEKIKQTNYIDIITKLTEQIDINKKDILELNGEIDNHYKIYEQIKRNFKKPYKYFKLK